MRVFILLLIPLLVHASYTNVFRLSAPRFRVSAELREGLVACVSREAHATEACPQ